MGNDLSQAIEDYIIEYQMRDHDRIANAVSLADWEKMCDLLGASGKLVDPSSAAARHKAEKGHRLNYGCCIRT